MKNSDLDEFEDFNWKQQQHFDLYQKIKSMQKRDPSSYRDLMNILRQEEQRPLPSHEDLFHQIEAMGLEKIAIEKLLQDDKLWMESFSHNYFPFEMITTESYNLDKVNEERTRYSPTFENYVFAHHVMASREHEKARILKEYKPLASGALLGTTQGPIVQEGENPHAMTWAGFAALHHQYSLAAQWLDEVQDTEEYKKTAVEVLIGLFSVQMPPFKISDKKTFSILPNEEYQVLFESLEDFWYEDMKLHHEYDSMLEVPSGFRIDNIHQALTATLKAATPEASNKMMLEILSDAILLTGNQKSTQWRPVDLLVRHVFSDNSSFTLEQGLSLIEKIDDEAFGLDKNGRTLLLALSESVFMHFNAEEVSLESAQRLDKLFGKLLSNSDQYVQTKWFENVMGTLVADEGWKSKKQVVYQNLNESWKALQGKVDDYRIVAHAERIKNEPFFEEKKFNNPTDWDMVCIQRKTLKLAETVLPIMTHLAQEPAKVLSEVRLIIEQARDMIMDNRLAKAAENREKAQAFYDGVEAAILNLTLLPAEDKRGNELKMNQPLRF